MANILTNLEPILDEKYWRVKIPGRERWGNYNIKPILPYQVFLKGPFPYQGSAVCASSTCISCSRHKRGQIFDIFNPPPLWTILLNNVVHVLVWLFSNLSRQKSPTADILGIHFIGTIVPIIYNMSIFLHFCFDKFENNQTRMRSTFSECQT